MPDLYLASKSPRRAELLAQIGVSFEVINTDVEERCSQGELPADYVSRLAMEKSMVGFKQSRQHNKPLLPTIGADTLINFNGRVFEKPKNIEHGVEMLLTLSGREHEVLSSVAITSSLGQDCLLSVTRVTFREISELEAIRYWRTNEPLDKAGGYGIQGLGAIFIKNINGSYSGVVGLPLCETHQLLEKHRVRYWNTSSAASLNKEL